MLKSVSKRIAAFLLMLTVLLSSNVYLVSATGMSATSSSASAGFGSNKLLKFGFRTTAKLVSISMDAIGDATGSEGANKAASLINTMLIGRTASNVKKVKSLCNEILTEIKDLKVDIYDCFSVVEKMLGEDRVKDAKKEVDEKWKEYITDVIDKNNATLACNYLDDYIASALNYSEDPDNNAYKTAYENNLELMMHGFAQMCKEDVPSSAYKDENMYEAKKIIFGGTSVDDSLMLLVEQFSANLTKNSNQSITLAESAAEMAYEYFPYSHQQYQYVNTVIGDQLTELSMCMLLASEYFDMKGEFILEEYGEASDEYAGYMNTLGLYQNTILNNINGRINEMLEAEMTVGVSTRVKLSDYMRPEDAQNITLKINDYKDEHSVSVLFGNKWDAVKTKKVYVNENTKFNRVMTHGGGKSNIYYIIDPSQFSSDAFQCLSLDCCEVSILGPDIHIASCDYRNLTKSMTDGVNTFSVPTKDGISALLNLFDTNAFSLVSRYPDSYLADYLPSKNSDTVFYFLTSSFYDDTTSNIFSTSYGHLYLAEGSTQIANTEIVVDDLSLEKFQSDKGGDIYKYSVILANQNDTYQQNAHLQVKDGISLAQIVNEDGSVTVKSGDSKKINSGDNVTIKFKLKDGAEFKSLKCIRNSDAVNNSGTTTETVLLEEDDFDLLTQGEDGYYSFEYHMPYSDATFIIEGVNGTGGSHDFDDNGFCTGCGAYQPAVRNEYGHYEISNAGQLYWFSSLVKGDRSLAEFEHQNDFASADLMNDIVVNNGDINKLASTQPGTLREWIPIGTSEIPYTGTFFGNGHTISGLYFRDTDADNVGLVGYSNGSNIYNVGIVNSYFEGRNSVGAVVGGDKGSGIFIVTKCYSEATVTGNEGVAGIVGLTYGGRILNCYNAGSVTGSKYVASIRGKNTYNTSSYGAIDNCFNVGTVKGTGSSNIGGIRGDGNGKISNCYCISTQLTDTAATTKTPEQFKSGEVAYLLNQEVTDGTQAWYQNIDNGKTPDDYPVFDGGTVYYGYTCGSESKKYTNYQTSDSPSTNHRFNDNGFCTICGQYQPATLNNGVYEIGNAGQLFWFASLVNNDSTHADFDAQNAGANAVLVKDINLESREWSPIMNFSGTFDGDSHTISNFNITNTSTYSGLFGKTSGTIKSFTVKGDMIISANGDYIGGAVGYADGATIKNVTSYVNISNTDGELKHIGGVVGGIQNNETFVEKCVYYGTMNIINSHDCIGGIVGYSNAGARISSCANHGTVSASKEDAYVGGILGYVNNTNPTLKDCYNYGTVSNGDSTTYCGAIIGWARNYTASNIDNNYYLDSSATLAFGNNGKSGVTATAKTADEFKSGKVAYLLNHKVTDGTQAWYQNIDNGETPDDYPVFDGGTVYYLEYKDSYSNTYSEKPEPDEFDKDDNGNFIIRTYDDLVKLSNLVRSDYEKYGSHNYILENNIKAPEDSKWIQGIGSVSDDKPFNGTFNGNGYCIIGLNVNSSEYGGLFEIIGENGVVKDLFVFDCDFSSSSKTAGGIAAVNEGKIDHCTSGVNITSGYIHKNEKDIYAPEFNSSINGEISGGVVGENSGSLIGCRSSAVVSGTICGGIAGVNTGKIYGCANNGKVGKSTSKISGGLAGKNGGTIESSYNSATVEGADGKGKGSVAGINGYDGLIPTVKSVYCIIKEGLSAIGADSTQSLDNTNIEKTDDKDMQSSEFTDTLNSVTDDSVSWKHNPPLNKGCPIIDGNFFINTVKSAGNGITVQGKMHKDLNISYDLCNENSEEYKLVSSAKGENKILKTYSVSLTDKDGNYIPAELWCSDSFKISVPVDSENIQLAGIDTDGNIVFCKPDSVKNGTAVFTVSHPMSFAIVEATAKNPSSVNNNNGTPIQTGSEMCGAILLVALLSLTVILFCKRRNKIG